ncbi:hypothetical protein ACTNE3_07720 [Bacillota bacterium HCP3S3_F1_1]|jgi:hypothetical protein
MYEVISGERDVSRVAVDTFKRQVAVGDGILEVEAGTNGYGPASRTYLRLQDIMGTDMDVEETHDSKGHVDGIVLKLAGGSELTAIINALNFMVKVLDEQRREVVG